MIKTDILQRDAPVLRQVAKSVPVKNIGSKKIRDVIERMKKALHAEDDGVAIAAPQIGESLRIFVVNTKAFTLASRKKKVEPDVELEDMVFINPEITKYSQKKKKVEEGCLSVRWLYGHVKRSEKVSLRAYDDKGKVVERGASGLLAQIFQHEVDHLNGILFIDKAENLQELPPAKEFKFVFFGSSQFSKYVLEELEFMGFTPALNVSSTRELPSLDELKKIEADVFVVASFGKILPKELIEVPKHGTLNVHPSLLPELRGPSPIQNTILGKGDAGVTIIHMDEKMDHGPILMQAKVSMSPWPDHYAIVEEKLGRVGGKMLGMLLPKWISGEVTEHPQDDELATFVKLVKKEDGLLDMDAPAEDNLRKVLAYSTWPGAYMLFKNKRGKEIRIVVKDAKIESGKFIPTRIIPAGKREMDWQDFLRGN